LSGLFVTGTDTGCGKTSVACVLAQALRSAGRTVAVLKPVETGCEAGVATDAVALARAAGDHRSLDDVCPYRFALPAAPNVAARAEQADIDLARIERAYRAARDQADAVLVEGAGGALVPVTDQCDMLGLVRRLELPLLVVARATLGTINHSLLTLEAARARGLEVLGLVVSHTEPVLSDSDHANLQALLEVLGPLYLGELLHGAGQLKPASGFESVLSRLAPAS